MEEPIIPLAGLWHSLNTYYRRGHLAVRLSPGGASQTVTRIQVTHRLNVIIAEASPESFNLKETSMGFVKALVIVAFTASSFSVSVHAQSKGRLAACKDDIQKFCASEPKGQGKVRACLQNNKDKVSPDCKTALDAAK